MTAFREAGRLIVAVPASMSVRDERALVPDLVRRFVRREARDRAPRSDAELTARAVDAFDTYLASALPAGTPRPPLGARWVSNQRRRWASCTPDTGEIRVSDVLRDAPDWVVDFVLVHELAHLLEHGHTRAFRALERRYPLAERAEGFLLGLTHARTRGALEDAGALD